MAISNKQKEALNIWYNNNKSFRAAAKKLNISRQAATGLVKRALAWENASTGQLEALKSTNLDALQATHGWRIITNPDGSRDSVFWKAEKDNIIEKENLFEVIKDSLKDLPKYLKIESPKKLPKDICNFIPLADLHVGSEYGDPKYLKTVFKAINNLTDQIPKAKKAVLLDMGDLLDANDHKGLTPASENNCDVIRENHLKNTIDAISIMKLAIDNLAKTHEEVEVHLLRGNHDETAYIAVMVGLYYHYSDNPQIKIIVNDDNFRVLPWGNCAIFPHHGDKAKWDDLKNVFSDQFPEEWAKAKYWRFIWTGHVHHDKQREMIGAVGEHFRTLAPANNWAMQKGLFSRGGIQCVTLHKEYGEISRTKVNLEPMLLQNRNKRRINMM